MSLATVLSTASLPADGAVAADGSYRTAATSKGALDGSLSAQWASRPDDQRFPTLSELLAHTRYWSMNSVQAEMSAADVRIEAVGNGGLDDLRISCGTAALTPTHFGFDQLASVADVPRSFIRREWVPAKLAAAALTLGLRHRAAEGRDIFAYTHADPEQGSKTLRAITSTRYGLIRDCDVVEEVMRFAGPGSVWKVPGCIDWGSSNGTTVRYNPHVDITKENTTLYASDRDLFIFLCDDTHPIQIGTLPNGEPDLVFRGFIASNSETGDRRFDLRKFLLRGVCQNRNLWGVEGEETISIRHNSSAFEHFAADVAPALEAYAVSSPKGIMARVLAAKARVVAKDDEDRLTFLTGYRAKLSVDQAKRAMQISLDEEDRPIETVWDASQAISALARRIPYQNERVELEARAGKLMELVH